jgi:hypothetical protein
MAIITWARCSFFIDQIIKSSRGVNLSKMLFFVFHKNYLGLCSVKQKWERIPIQRTRFSFFNHFHQFLLRKTKLYKQGHLTFELLFHRFVPISFFNRGKYQRNYLTVNLSNTKNMLKVVSSVSCDKNSGFSKKLFFISALKS